MMKVNLIDKTQASRPTSEIPYGSIPGGDEDNETIDMGNSPANNITGGTGGSGGGSKMARNTFYGTNFRFILGGLLLICVTMACYSFATLYITAIRMISSDVLATETTRLRAKHQATLEWLQVPSLFDSSTQDGTCPVAPAFAFNALESQVEQLHLALEGLNTNISQLVRFNSATLAHSILGLFEDVRFRLSEGKLVDWSIEERGLIFSASRFGHTLSALPLSRLGLHYGPKNIASLGVIVCALHTLLLPVVAGHTPFWFTMIFEFVSGCLNSGMITVIYPLVACWFLPHEASVLVALVNIGAVVGASLNDFVSAQMLAYEVSWWWVFYLSGIVNVVLAIAWMVLAADRPEKSQFITREELIILENSVAKRKVPICREAIDPNECCLCNRLAAGNCPAKIIKRVPIWTKLATCPCILSIVVVFFGAQWSAQGSLMLPTFFANILHWDASTIGWVISSKGVFALLYGTLFAYLTRKLAIDRPFKMSLTAFRRFSQILATFFEFLVVMLRVIFDCSLVANSLSVIMLVVVNNFDVISFLQLPLDLSPEDSGLIVSWVRLLSLAENLSTPVAGWILATTTDSPDLANGDRHSWRLVWLLNLIVKLAACVCFVAFARAEPRSYSRLKPAGACKTRRLLRQTNKEEGDRLKIEENNDTGIRFGAYDTTDGENQ